MVDISRVSQNVRQMLDDIASKDGKKGISSQEERNALADLLSSGKVTGQSNLDYIQGEINNFDLKEAAKNASDFVKNVIKDAMKMTGGKDKIDDKTELAVLDSIINNSDGTYSAEDIQYAKLLKEQSQYAGVKSPETLLREENQVLMDKNAELMKENAELKAELEETKKQAQEANAELDKTMSEIKDVPKEVMNTVNEIKVSLKSLSDISSETSKLVSELKDKQDTAIAGKLSKATFESFVKQAQVKIKANKTKLESEKTNIKEGAEKLGKLKDGAAGISTVASILQKIGAGASGISEAVGVQKVTQKN